jgi:hypothetical protein
MPQHALLPRIGVVGDQNWVEAISPASHKFSAHAISHAPLTSTCHPTNYRVMTNWQHPDFFAKAKKNKFGLNLNPC